MFLPIKSNKGSVVIVEWGYHAEVFFIEENVWAFYGSGMSLISLVEQIHPHFPPEAETKK